MSAMSAAIAPPLPADVANRNAGASALNDKDSVRQQIKAHRHALSDAVREKASAQICEMLWQFPKLQNAKCIAAFAATADEVNIWPLLHQLLAANKIVALPRVQGKRSMTFHQIQTDSINALESGVFNILQPPNHFREVIATDFDFCIVPSLAVNRTRHRLGYGGGFYDTFKQQCPAPQPFFATPIFQCQYTDSFPIERHDMQLDAVFSEGSHGQS